MSEVQKWEVKANPIRKMTVRPLEVFSCSAATSHSGSPQSLKITNRPEVLVVVGTSKSAAVSLEGAQEFADQAMVAKRMGSLVARSEYTDYRSVQSSQSSGRVLAAQCTGAGSGEGSLVVAEHNSAMALPAAARHLRIQSRPRETQ